MSPASRIDNAISFGVFCRSAPSTSAIIRSRNVSPGFALICTTIRSLSTRVPPVTALRSPPLSRITGALSPVIADSSTVAMPSTMSPSPGITSPATTSQRSPIASSDDERMTIVPSGWISRAIVSARVAFKVAACALPRPSAIASAKFAKRTVNHRNPATRAENTFSWVSASPTSRRNSTVVSTAPTSTMNITGFLAIVRGSSLRTESSRADVTIVGSKIDREADGLVRTFGARCAPPAGGSGSRVVVVLTATGAPGSGPGRGRGRT